MSNEQEFSRQIDQIRDRQNAAPDLSSDIDTLIDITIHLRDEVNKMKRIVKEASEDLKPECIYDDHRTKVSWDTDGTLIITALRRGFEHKIFWSREALSLLYDFIGDELRRQETKCGNIPMGYSVYNPKAQGKSL
jgi:hypothetical protein